MPVSPRINQGHLERALGGTSNLLQLVDTNGTNDINDVTCQANIADLINDANGEVNSYVEEAIDLTDPSQQTSPLLMSYEKGVAAYLAWLRNVAGLDMPPKTEKEYQRVIGELEKIQKRGKGIGMSPRPATGQVVTEVAKDQQTDDWTSTQSPRRYFDGWS